MYPAHRGYLVLLYGAAALSRLNSGRVSGFGGNPGGIPPSSGGNLPGRLPHSTHHADFLELTGKVMAVIYDRFGDFTTFRLLTDHGYEKVFQAQEPAVEALAKSAWIERSVISARVAHHRSDWPAAIVLKHYH